jgi:hypothetical protein
MRRSASVTSLSWIPSEAVSGLNQVVFASGFTHYDDPPPDHVDDLEALRAADRFRWANRLEAWIDVRDGEVAACGYSGGIVMGSTTVHVARRAATFTAVAFPDLQRPPEVGDGWVRFVQTVGGHTALPAPRRVAHPPFLKLEAPTVWTTLALTIHHDGRSEFELVGASPFPRHWLYDEHGDLAAKAGTVDFTEWYRHAFGRRTPWGDAESPQLVTVAETAIERALARQVMRAGAVPVRRSVPAGELLTRQGDESSAVYLLLDGVLRVDVDGEPLAEVGPGAILGERAALEGGTRTASLVALTRARVAVVAADQLDVVALRALSGGHRREDAGRGAAAGAG